MANRPRAKEGNQPPAVDVSVLNVAPSTTASGAASGAAAASQVTPAGIEKPPVTAAAPTQTGKPRSNALPSTQTGPGLAQQSTGAVATTTPVGPIVVPKSHSRNKALQSGRFAINTYLWHPGGQYADATGSILSQSLEKMLSGQGHSSRYVGDLTMGQLRKLVPGMSSFSRIHRFCTADGTAMIDETLSLDDYLSLDATEDEIRKPHGSGEGVKDGLAHGAGSEAPKATVPKLIVYYRTPARVATAGMDLANAAAPALNMGLSNPPGTGYGGDPNVYDAGGTAGGLAQAPVAPAPNSIIKTDMSLTAGYYGNTASVTAGSLSENQWADVLRNCSVFFGWKVDRGSGQIVKAPRAAFQLRSKIRDDLVAQIPAFVEDDVAIARQGANTEYAGFDRSMSEGANAERGEVTRSGDQNEQSVADRTKFQQKDFSAYSSVSKLAKAMPNFRVNDDSRIEVIACQDSLAVSMAKNDFSSQSTEASVAGGANGVTAGVSSGVATSEANTHVNKTGSTTQTLLAKYMYPRCDIFLRAEDLEPTPELRALLNHVKYGKSIDSVRAIHDQFGQLFCQELTLGARLATTKIIKVDEKTTIDEHKEQLKVSVGVSVQSPYGGANVKREQEEGSGTTKAVVTTSTRESNVFEAVGGDTILANNPAVWAPSAATPNLWRVINRDALSPMIDMISAMPSFEKIQMWFMQAMPAIQNYIRLNTAMSVNVRFKVLTPTNSLSIENLGNSVYYLGFQPFAATVPRLNGKHEAHDRMWERVDLQTTHVLFHPPSYRAPALYGFENFGVSDGIAQTVAGMIHGLGSQFNISDIQNGVTKSLHGSVDGPFGSKFNATFAENQWELTAPFVDEFNTGNPYELQSGSRVILRTVPFRNPNLKLKEGEKDPTPPPCHMVVFRNAQGVFLPAVSDRDEYQYWRVEIVDGDEGEPIKGGDRIRLSWSFADQTTGFRDYVEDVFGRRRNQCPADLESQILYLKVPWPRFEVSGTPTALMLSPQSTTDVVSETIATRQGNFPYTLQDLQFRIDTVERHGRGDSDDYMLAGLPLATDERKETVTQTQDPEQWMKQNGPRPAPSPAEKIKGDIQDFGNELGGKLEGVVADLGQKAAEGIGGLLNRAKGWLH